MLKKFYENKKNQKLDSHKTHHIRGLILSGTLHIIVFVTFLFDFNTHKHISLQKQSIPISITKLSDITTGPVLGPAGIIDESVPMAETDQDIVPIDINKDPDKVENNQMANASKPEEVGSDTKNLNETDLEPIDKKALEKDLSKDSSKKDMSMDDLLDLQPDLKQITDKKSKEKELDNKLGFKEIELKKDKKKSGENKKEKEKESKDKNKDKRKDEKNKNGKNKNDKSKQGDKKGKKDNSLNKFINDVLGSPDGRTTNKSGGAQALGELSASTLAVLREMIRPCWTIVSIPRANETNVRIEVDVDQEGFVSNTKILNPNWSDPVFKTVANSATRALADKRCQPFKLPISQYNQWKKLIINFCPADF